MSTAIVSSAFDDLRSRGIRFLHEASKQGEVHVMLWTDRAVQRQTGRPPRFPEAERRYLVEALRYVARVTLVDDELPKLPGMASLPEGTTWVVDEEADTEEARLRSAALGFRYCVIEEAALVGFPDGPNEAASNELRRKKALVTGCYDWLHSGHLRFFEEVAALGDLYVVVGNDANVRMLKGSGHPLYPAVERRYVAGSIRCVKQCLVATGAGWLDAEPEIACIRPDIYAVNEDGDRPEKRRFCEDHGLEYVVLKRRPKDGLPRRASSELRGF